VGCLSVVYFTDRDLGKRFPEILKSNGLKVERHSDHFAPDTPDAEWLEVVGERGWVALTHDRRIRYKTNERDAVVRHGVALLVVVGAAPFPDLAHGFIATVPRIERFLVEHEPPFIAKVYRPAPSEMARGAAAGRIELWYPRRE
jgi:PIN like domain